MLNALILLLGLVILVASIGFGILLPAAVPDRLLLVALGALAVIFVLIRLISVPDMYFVSTARGIGLYVSQEIVEMHGGSIWVEQPEDGGSRFVVRLPPHG